MQDFKPDNSMSWRTVELTSGKTIYYTTSRPMDIINEYNKVTDEVISLINNTYSVKKISVIDKDAKSEKGVIYDYPDYYGRAVYGQHTKIGNFIVIPINIILVIVCLALYFPLFKAIFNLFRRKKPKANKTTSDLEV